MLNQPPYYPGYEWQVIGDNLVLIALSTAIVTAVINGVFDWFQHHVQTKGHVINMAFFDALFTKGSPA